MNKNQIHRRKDFLQSKEIRSYLSHWPIANGDLQIFKLRFVTYLTRPLKSQSYFFKPQFLNLLMLSAMDHNKHDIFNSIIKHSSVDVNCSHEGMTLLAYAHAYDSDDCPYARSILEQCKLDIGLLTKHEFGYRKTHVPQIFLVLLSGNLELVKLLEETHPNVYKYRDAQQTSCLIPALYSKNIEVVKYLVDKYPELIDDFDIFHYACPSFIAYSIGAFRIYEFLVEKGAEIKPLSLLTHYEYIQEQNYYLSLDEKSLRE